MGQTGSWDQCDAMNCKESRIIQILVLTDKGVVFKGWCPHHLPAGTLFMVGLEMLSENKEDFRRDEVEGM